MLNNNFELSGRFRMVTRKSSTGEVRCDTGWFDNIITNYGLDCIGFGYNAITGCTVGTGTTPENENDTQIEVFKARTGTGAPGAPYGAQVGSTVSPYYAKYVATYRFDEGVAAGNLTEVGIIARNYTAPYNLWSRTLIKDSSGNPVTITVLDDEILDVSYECHVYPQQGISEGTANILGNNYDYKLACAEIANAHWASALQNGLQPSGPIGVLSVFSGNGITPAPSHQPSGSYVDFAGNVVDLDKLYEAGDYRLNIRFTLPPGSLTRQLPSFSLKPGSGANPGYSLALSPSFDKISTVEFKIVLSVAWSRRS